MQHLLAVGADFPCCCPTSSDESSQSSPLLHGDAQGRTDGSWLARRSSPQSKDAEQAQQLFIKGANVVLHKPAVRRAAEHKERRCPKLNAVSSCSPPTMILGSAAGGLLTSYMPELPISSRSNHGRGHGGRWLVTSRWRWSRLPPFSSASQR
ncbi:unnamed protein product [Effrenium voratum]|uniref:Uncharacterized protein n=1 Tax=Effrenium voratum TaxID=2562239 RepID=A0AA36N9M5_9DINO|nr:unnamed protein product [Effrenium voratum]CAJ1420685.1 unnamed protein product [Effrenium voratum]